MADRQADDFKLGNKAADMWLYTADACANEKVIPKKYRYTTGTALMNGAEAICSCIEGANLIDLRERPAERLAMQREALCECKKLERKILRMAESKQYPGVSGQKAAGLPHRPMEEWDYAEGWVIKGDIRHFFQSIDHRRLKAALEPRFPDPDIRALMWRYIDAVDEGLALGHQTSHIYAVFYVSSFMHYVGEKLHLPLAGMYMDDWYVICPDKATAVEALRLARLEFAKLGLELNDKTNIFPLQNGIDFCGFHTYLTRTGQVVSKLRYSSIKRMKRRIRLWEKQYAAGEVPREKIMESFTAWEAHAKHGDTKQLRREMRSRLLMALDRADEARRAAGIPAARPGPDERRTKRYGTVTFQSGKRQPGEAGGKQQAHQVHQAGQ